MSVPDPIGPIHYSEPRAVQIRMPGNLTEIHSAVNGNVNVYADSMVECNAVLEQWPSIIQAAADRANQILDAVRAQVAADNQPDPVPTHVSANDQ